MPDWFCSPTGTAGGTGFIGSPWDLATVATGAGGQINAGDTIFFRGGTYTIGQSLFVTLAGTVGSPIVCRPYLTEKPIIDMLTDDPLLYDPTFNIDGAYNDWIEFEFFSSYTASRVTDGIPVRGSIEIDGDNCRVLNCVIHDLNKGFGFWSQGEGGELNGNVIYNCGWENTGGTPHGHGIYTQNATGEKLCKDNTVLANFNYGLHAFGSGAADIRDINFIRNLVSGQTSQSIMGGGAPAESCEFRNNHIFGFTCDFDVPGTAGHSIDITDNFVFEAEVRFYQQYTTTSLVLTGNVVYHDTALGKVVRFQDFVNIAWTWNNNIYYSPSGVPFTHNAVSKTFTTWKSETTFDASSSLFATDPGDSYSIYANDYNADRAHLVIHNWSDAAAVNVDLSSIASNGETYDIYHGYDLVNPVASGTWLGTDVSVSMAAKSAPPTIGSQNRTIPSMPSTYGIFLIKLNSQAQGTNAMIENIPVVQRNIAPGKMRFTFRTFDPTDRTSPVDFDPAVEREIEFVKDDADGNVRTIGTDGVVTYDVGLEFWQSRALAGGTAVKTGVHHLVVDMDESDAGHVAFWTAGEYLCRLKQGKNGSITYADDPLFRLILGPEIASLEEAPGTLLRTKVDAVSTPLRVFTMDRGSATAGTYVGHRIRIQPSSGSAEITDGIVKAYNEGTFEVTLEGDALSLTANDDITIYSADSIPIIDLS